MIKLGVQMDKDRERVHISHKSSCKEIGVWFKEL
jgi:hypothetical protein